MKIYTKTGDSGETGLADGSRVGKDHLRIRLVGETDELNSALGLALALFERDVSRLSALANSDASEANATAPPQAPSSSECSNIPPPTTRAASRSSNKPQAPETAESAAVSRNPSTPGEAGPPAPLPTPEALRQQVQTLQALLFELGASLAGASAQQAGLRPSDLQQLEDWIDALQASLPSLRHFILPGGCPSAAQFHLARATCRRLERSLVQTSQDSQTLAPFAPAPPQVFAWINRLSDYLFLLARAVNRHCGAAERPWRPRS